MEKRGLKFFILRVLAHQLQNWADSVSRQAGEAAYPVQSNQLAVESSETENATSAALQLSTSMPAGQELEQVGKESAFADTPPAHWLARVQKDAPELLEQMGQARQNRRPPHPLPSTQKADAQADTWPRQGMAESGQMMKAEHPVTRKQTGTEQVEMKSPAETSPVIAVPVTSASFPTIEAPGQPGVTAAGVDDRSTREQTPVDASELSELPVRRPRAVQKDAPEREQRRSSLDGVSQSLPLSPTETMDAGQRARKVEIKQAEKRLDMLEEMGTQQSEARKAHRDERTVTAAPDAVPPGTVVTGRGSESNIYPGFQISPVAWSSSPAQQDISPWRESESLHSLQQSRQSLWIRESLSANIDGLPASSKASEQMQGEMGWPALPDAATSNDQDWEVALRLWERRRRLNEEQRGNPWNV